MILENFSVKGLFGLINANIKFQRDLNVIVGPNGSGKTSVLSLLSSLVRLDIDAIKSMSFESIELRIDAESAGKIVIEAANSSEQAYISIQWDSVGSVKIPLVDPDTIFRQGVKRYSMSTVAATLGLSKSAEVAEFFQQWTKISNEFQRLSKLTFVRLDRTIIAMDPEGLEAIDQPSSNSRERPRISNVKRDPIDEVIRVTQLNYFEYKRQVDVIRSEAYHELVRLHFLPIKPLGKKANVGQLRRKLSELRARVSGSALTSDMQELTKAFFESFENLLQQTDTAVRPKRSGRKTLAEESIQLMLELKEQQTEQLVSIFENEQKKLVTAHEPIKRYLDTLSNFLSESGKTLWFSDESLQLAFYMPAAGEGPIGAGRNLKDLSSGERQVLIVLTYLAFMSGPNSIFIIDEPELSLHLRWQGYLIDALRSLRPAGGQILIATHAPEIAGRAVKHCIQLSQSYLPNTFVKK